MNRSLFAQFRFRYSGFVVLLTVATFAVAALLAAPPAPGASPGERRAAELEREIGQGAHVLASAETGEVRFVGTNPGAPIERLPGLSANAGSERVSRAFLQRYGRYFGLGDQRRELELDDRSTGPDGGAWVRMQQVHEGVPVLGGQLVVNLDRDRNLRSVSGELLPEPTLEVEPRIGPVEAGRAATTAVAKAYGVATSRLRGTLPELSIYDSRLLGGPGLDAPRLVWRVEVNATGGPIREFVLVDAQLGSVALQLDQIAHGKVREVCDAGNADTKYPCTSALAERSEGEAPAGTPDVDDAYDFAGDTYDFFADRFGRDSLDDNGMKLVSTARYCPPGESCPYENAFWDGAQMVYGEGFAAADDVVGHELSHGVTEFSSHLFYYYQSGAINESLSDVFGEFIDLTNGSGSDSAADRWLLGEDIPGIGAIRDMADPTSFGDPDRMTSPNYTADSGEGDAGGVHTNSSVNNKAAYLMSDGDTFNGQTVDGLGIDKVARIYYEVESAMLTSASDYADLASGLGQACANLVGTNGISAADCNEVAEAVQATEMSQQPPAAPATEAPTCATGTAMNAFIDDLETPAAGNWTRTSSAGSNEWYYPQNSNPYAFDATYATSGSGNFWGYDRPSTGDYSIEMSSDVTVPAAPAFMRFEHAYGFEDNVSPSRNWDGGVVEYSTDGGSTWNDAGGLITDNGYSGAITSSRGSTNPLKGREAFVGESNGYISSRLDLASLEGEDVRFRFRIGTDASVDDYGWFVDDVQIYGCAGGDTDPPDTAIDTGPTGTIKTNQATFTFSGTPAGDTAKIQCRLDSQAFSDCTSPKTFTGLTDGPHTATFRAEDAAGNQDPSPATRTFTVDTTAPDTAIDSGPTGTTGDSTPSFEFSSEPGASFECRVDSDAFSSCSSPETVAALTDGPHSFEVKATDQVGNTDPSPATRTFTVDTTAPDTAIDSGPTGTIATDQASFTFAGTPAGDTAKIQCKLDSGSYSDCISPKTFTGLTDGPHTASFRAEDAAGNQDPSPATRTFTVDTTVYKAKIKKVKVKGPAKVKKGKKAIYKVKITNSGNAKATGVRLKVKGRGVSFNTSVGKIAAKKTRAVKVKLKAKKPGKVKLTFKVTSKNAGGKTVKKKIKVRK
jgi:bacillolysin